MGCAWLLWQCLAGNDFSWRRLLSRHRQTSFFPILLGLSTSHLEEDSGERDGASTSHGSPWKHTISVLLFALTIALPVRLKCLLALNVMQKNAHIAWAPPLPATTRVTLFCHLLFRSRWASFCFPANGTAGFSDVFSSSCSENARREAHLLLLSV